MKRKRCFRAFYRKSFATSKQAIKLSRQVDDVYITGIKAKKYVNKVKKLNTNKTMNFGDFMEKTPIQESFLFLTLLMPLGRNHSSVI